MADRYLDLSTFGHLSNIMVEQDAINSLLKNVISKQDFLAKHLAAYHDTEKKVLLTKSQREVEELKEELIALRAQNQQCQNDNQRFQSQLAHHESEDAAQKKLVKELRGEIKDLQNTIKDRDTKFKAYSQKIRQYDQEMSEKLQEQESTVDALKRSLKRKREQMEAAITVKEGGELLDFTRILPRKATDEEHLQGILLLGT